MLGNDHIRPVFCISWQGVLFSKAIIMPLFEMHKKLKTVPFHGCSLPLVMNVTLLNVPE